jgi:hypothetical protein
MVMRRDRLLVAILCWTALVMGVQFWLPFVRSVTQGAAYPWGLGWGIRGNGLSGDFWVLVLGVCVTSLVLYLGWRGAPRLFHVLVLAMHVPLTALAIEAAWRSPESFRFQGATIGVEFSLALVGPLLVGGFTLASVFWVVRDLRSRQAGGVSPWIWTRSTRVRLVLVVAAFPIEAVLFRSGDLTSIQNVIGVGLVGWQWWVLNRVLAVMPFRPEGALLGDNRGTPEAGA